MAEPMPERPAQRSAAQVENERAMAHVSEVLTNLEWTIEKAKKGLKDMRRSGDDTNASLALAGALKELERTRKRLFQDTYFGGDTPRLL